MVVNAVVIGAGPAGLSGAIAMAEKGIQVIVIDEYMKAGGRLIGQLYEEPTGGYWNGVQESNNLFQKAQSLNVKFKLQTPVTNLERINNQWYIYTDEETYITDYLLLATGAAETPLPIPGWTLPGVMSIGAAQVMTNVHRVKPGNKGIIIGVNVLSSAIAMELKMADIHVECMTLPMQSMVTEKTSNPVSVINSLLHVSHMAPSPLIQLGSKFLKNDFLKKLGITLYPKNGVKMWGIPIILRKAVVKIYGQDQVEGVVVAKVSSNGEIIAGTEEKIPVDFVCIAGGLYPLAELASLAGCPFHWIEELGGYVPLHNTSMETTLEGLYVAGNITGIEGAKVAMKQGIVAGLSIANQIQKGNLEHEILQAIQNVDTTREQAFIQFHPDILKGKKKLQQYWDQYNNFILE